MEIGMIGLGRMGAGMARRLARGGARVVAYDREKSAREALAGESGIECAEGYAALASGLAGERVALLMLPAGAPTEDALRELLPLLSAGDTLVDGGNAFYRDSMARALELSQRGLRYVDAGVSGGVHGLANGYCLMLGGTPKSIEIFEPFARILAPAPETGWLHCGPSGAGHYAKMIHNGIEYGMMQALAEGFSLLDLSAQILKDDEELKSAAPVVADSGEGRWTALESVELGVPAPVITMALMARFSSQGRSDYARRLLAMMRASFGGHEVKRG